MQYVKFLLLISLFLISCKKEKKEENTIVNEFRNGILVLNEGLFQMNNSSLSWCNKSDLSVNNEIFEQKNERKLGDTGNDLKRYGNKIYVIVNVSSTLEILDVLTGKVIKQISFVEGNKTKQPRSICFYGNKAFISCFDGYVDVIDTVNFQLQKRIKVGLNPDHIVCANSKVFVSNSGGLNSPKMDSTISVINPISLTEEQKIIVGMNPGQLIEVLGNLFVQVRGNYGSIPSTIKQIQLSDLQISQTHTKKALFFENINNQLLVVFEDGNKNYLGTYDVFESTWTNTNIFSLASIETLYGIQYDKALNHIFIFDAKGYTVSGEVLEYTLTGDLLNRFKVGLNPSKLLLFK